MYLLESTFFKKSFAGASGQVPMSMRDFMDMAIKSPPLKASTVRVKVNEQKACVNLDKHTSISFSYSVVVVKVDEPSKIKQDYSSFHRGESGCEP